MDIFCIRGGTPLHGRIALHGAKNAALPLLAATLATGARCELLDCPDISDVTAACAILRHLGCAVEQHGGIVAVDAGSACRSDIPAELMRKMRAAVLFLGPLLARFGTAELSLPGGCIGVLATEATLREEKFAALLQRCAENCHILKCPCPELVEFVERGELTGPALERCLAARLAPVLAAGPDALVLGCTHFPFAAGAIRRVVGPDVELLDGSAGTARETKRRLLDAGLLVQQGEGSVTIENSLESPAILALSRQLLHAPIFPGRESFDK